MRKTPIGSRRVLGAALLALILAGCQSDEQASPFRANLQAPAEQTVDPDIPDEIVEIYRDMIYATWVAQGCAALEVNAAAFAQRFTGVTDQLVRRGYRPEDIQKWGQSGALEADLEQAIADEASGLDKLNNLMESFCTYGRRQMREGSGIGGLLMSSSNAG